MKLAQVERRGGRVHLVEALVLRRHEPWHVDLETELAESVSKWETDVAAHDKAVATWVVERELLEVRANEKETERVEVYRDPTCSDLAKINITAVCPAFVSGMRDRADSLNGN